MHGDPVGTANYSPCQGLPAESCLLLCDCRRYFVCSQYTGDEGKRANVPAYGINRYVCSSHPTSCESCTVYAKLGFWSPHCSIRFESVSIHGVVNEAQYDFSSCCRHVGHPYRIVASVCYPIVKPGDEWCVGST